MVKLLLVVHVMLALTVIGLVLLQQGKGANAGASFGGGASSTVFGARGSATFLSRTTGVLAAGFFITSLTLASIYGNREQPQSVIEQMGGAMTTTEQGSAVPADVPTPIQKPSSDVPSGK